MIKNNRQHVTVPHPGNDLSSVQSSVIALKEAVEVLMAQRGHPADHAVTWADLIRLGLAKEDQVPVTNASRRLGGPS